MANEGGKPSDALEAALVDVVAVLGRAGISYALIGGLATAYRSRPRYTKDIDLILDIPQIVIPTVLENLRSLGFEFDQREVIEDFTQYHMAVLWRDGVRIDWLKPLLHAVPNKLLPRFGRRAHSMLNVAEASPTSRFPAAASTTPDCRDKSRSA
jgi:hypothetical protein